MDEINTDPAWEQACRHVATFAYEGIEFKMRGDKSLVDVKIEPRLLQSCSPEELAEVFRRGINLCRVVADFEATMLYNELSGVAEILEDFPEDMEVALKVDERSRGAPELIAGFLVLLEQRGWGPEDVARRSGIPEHIVRELLFFKYTPFGAIHDDKTLSSMIDVARPIAAAFGVTALSLWKKGRARIEQRERQRRLRIKRGRRAVRRHRQGRKPTPAQLRRLRLGRLEQQDVMPDIELEAITKTEVLWDHQRGIKPFMPWPKSPKRGDDDYGPLLLGNAGALRESITGDEYRKLMDLDKKANKDPASVTEDELAWVRELLGLPDLEIAAAED